MGDQQGLEKRNMRIRLFNIPSLYGVSQVRKFVANFLEIPLEAVVCRKAPKWTHALLSFRSTDSLTSTTIDLEKFCKKLSGAEWKRSRLDAKLEEAKEALPINPGNGSVPVETKSLNDQVTPLWKVPYSLQLEQKQTRLQGLLRKVACTDFCLEPIKASPQVTGYRNKCEFTIALDKEGLPTVGFLLGGYRDGIITVENARDTLHVPNVLKCLADHLQSFVRTSQLPIYDRSSKEGFWRLMLARVHDDNVMVAVQVTSSMSPPTAIEAVEPRGEEEETIIEKLVTHMKAFEYQGGNPIKSFFIQETSAVHHGIDTKSPFKLHFGQETVTQTLEGLKFRISPLSFFQVNTEATEILYQTIKEYVRDSLSSQTLLLDLCCGTGTIGMTLAPHVKRVVGVEIVKDAIDDAKINAQTNGITNMEFICNRVEAAIDRIITTIPPSEPIVVILDPPRNGVNVSVIKAVRRCSRICRVVFVSCNPDAAITNFMDLTRPETKGMIGHPFKLSRAVPVDLFPQTEHCELVLQFHRDDQPNSPY